jgi:hypothetical protein
VEQIQFLGFQWEAKKTRLRAIARHSEQKLRFMCVANRVQPETRSQCAYPILVTGKFSALLAPAASTPFCSPPRPFIVPRKAHRR